jgi:hypothetical protein
MWEIRIIYFFLAEKVILKIMLNFDNFIIHASSKLSEFFFKSNGFTEFGDSALTVGKMEFVLNCALPDADTIIF